MRLYLVRQAIVLPLGAMLVAILFAFTVPGYCGDIGPYQGKDTQSNCLPNVIRPGSYSRRAAAGLKLGEQLLLRDNVVVILQ